MFLGRLRLPLFSSSWRRGFLLVKRTLGTSVPTFIWLVFSLFQFDYYYLGGAGFIDYAYLDWWAGGGEGGWTEEVVFCVDYHYAVAFYREWAYDCVDCVHVGFVALGVEHQAVSPCSSSHSFRGLAGAGLLADYALGVWADAPGYQRFGVCDIAKRCPYIFFEGVLLGESFFDLVGDLGARGAYEHYVVEWCSPEEVGYQEGAGVDVGVVVVYYESACLSALFSVFFEGVDYCVLPFAQATAYVRFEWAT